jgi:hypothetical protein
MFSPTYLVAYLKLKLSSIILNIYFFKYVSQEFKKQHLRKKERYPRFIFKIAVSVKDLYF